MIKYLLIFLLPLTLFSSKILSYNIYDRTDRADVMITFDTPYEGVIKQSSTPSKIIIKLQDTSIESSKIKQLSSKFLHSLSITPMSGYTQIVASVPSSVKLIASKTSDSYGLRLRFTDRIAKSSNESKLKSENPLSNLPTKRTDDMNQSYYIVIAILIIGILILFFIRKKVTPTTPQQQNSWLFKETKETIPPVPNTQNNTSNEVSIRFQKSINNENSVVMLDFGEESYLVLMGKSNILLDKFRDNKPTNQKDFETILQTRHKELDDFLDNTHEEKEPLEIYKEKAATLSYTNT